MTVPDLTDRLKAEARRQGFDLVGIAPAVTPPGYPQFLDWLNQGREAGMAYMRRQAEARAHPDRLLEGVRSVVVVGFVYGQPEPPPTEGHRGKVARYARGGDYHELLWKRLESLLDWLQAESPGVRGRAVSDTAPLLERDFARLAGLGWIGKNTMLINRGLGSFTVLGALLTDAELRPDEPHQASHCGTCTRCLDACPTDAFDGPYRLDAARCISYLTIEHRGPIVEEFAGRLEGWVFGCDVCQDVCPWNRKAPPGRTPELDPRPGSAAPDLIGWLLGVPPLSGSSLKGTALSRAKRSGLLRNAALILGERRELAAVSALIARLADEDPVVRGAVAWALGRMATDDAVGALERARHDQDPVAREAIHRALRVAAGQRGLSGKTRWPQTDLGNGE
jgi:epoxyqueuosine reductase